MLQTNDIGVLFATLQAAYGHQWPHKADVIPVWQAKLNNYDVKEVLIAAGVAIEKYPDFPPSIGQLIEIIRSNKPRATTYLEDQRPNGRMSYADWKKTQ